ncbi:MAG: HD domain-containing protein [Planctomycetaceae bacterium]|jgi:HD superfamily phosphohydrolase|nr:HD domain-containing protein [Planctomycetaceae bacterium]
MSSRSEISEIPELRGLDSRHSLIRIPPELDVPLTLRVRRIIDTAAFRRLAKINQLGLVSLVYPAANHTRFEHSLGVYRLALLFLKQIANDRRFTELLTSRRAETFIAAALLHDIGHWAFCHPIEDVNIPGFPKHEQFAEHFLTHGEIADILRNDWNIEPQDVAALINKSGKDAESNLLISVLSGPVDVDKMDYLFRDSLHAGVPYGRHFDQGRLIGSLCLNEQGNGLAIADKGKTAAELMVFARYVMFSEVYWHHGVRSATAMLQRAFYLLRERIDCTACLQMTESQMIEHLLDVSQNTPSHDLLDRLFGNRRRLYKRVAQYGILEQPELYRLLAGKPYSYLCQCAENFAEILNAENVRVAEENGSRPVAPTDLLIDAPPVEKEVEFRIDVYYPKERRYRPLEQVSPVVRALAKEQFDDYVKRVRIFAIPELAAQLRNLPHLERFWERSR